MVVMGATRARHVPRVSLASLLAIRDASLAVRPSTRSRIKAAIGVAAGSAGAGIGKVWRLTATLLTLVLSGLLRHGLVLGGLSAWVWAAWSVSALAGGVVLGAALFFLEARRR